MVVCLAVLAAAASQALQGLDPSMALLVNQFNHKARVETIMEALGGQEADVDAAMLHARTGSRIDPADGRYLSLLALGQAKQGDMEGAQRSFDLSLKIMPTEIQALYNRFAVSLSRQDIKSALEAAYIIARRWPGYRQQIEPHLPALLTTPENLTAASRVLGDEPRRRALLVTGLTKSPATVGYAIAVLDQWKQDGVPLEELRPLTNTVSNALFAAKDYARAYFLFRSMLDGEQQKVTGYIHNADFRQQPSGNVFDWRISSQAGAIVSIGERGLEVRFRDSPVRFSGARQSFRLPPGRYSIELDYSTRSLVTPKPLMLVAGCVDSRQPLARLEIRSGNDSSARETAEFDVPATGCPALTVQLVNEYVAQSWSNRYSGTVTLHHVGVQRIAEPGS